MLANGGYAREGGGPEALLVPDPDEVSDDQAAALLLQGVTALALVHVLRPRREGETVVVEAAAGGTGSLAVQLAKRAGAQGDRASPRARRSASWPSGSAPTRPPTRAPRT